MKTLEYYIELRLIYKEIGEDQTFFIDLTELSETLYCSPRHVKRLMKNMENEELIVWKPGRGRGKRSQLQFKRSLEEVLPPFIEYMIQQGRLKEATRLIKRDGIPSKVRESSFHSLLNELSIPAISMEEDELKRLRTLFQKQSPTFAPAIVSTPTGRWFSVKGVNTNSQK
ncbi:SgrR family transcriptional regulator [Salinithrix halophila]|uniref:SgrR family transcriptional regulator n=1 Tax=Salinithrix halophila TaxID=1485204 RepID=A0ABV8JLG1_9BACL